MTGALSRGAVFIALLYSNFCQTSGFGEHTSRVRVEPCTSRTSFGQSHHFFERSRIMSQSKDDHIGHNVPRIDSIEPVAATKWLSLQTISYTDQEGKARKWDVATRTTKQRSDAADAVVIIPILKHHTTKSDTTDTILVEQFRPPVSRSTVEFPAGLIDKDETPENAALRELREETGYVGERCKRVPQVSRQVCMSPGLTDESVNVVVVEVDLDNPYNHGTPTPELDEGEHIKIKRLPLREGLRKVLEEGESMPIMGLYLFALGLEMGQELV